MIVRGIVELLPRLSVTIAFAVVFCDVLIVPTLIVAVAPLKVVLNVCPKIFTDALARVADFCAAALAKLTVSVDLLRTMTWLSVVMAEVVELESR